MHPMVRFQAQHSHVITTVEQADSGEKSLKIQNFSHLQTFSIIDIRFFYTSSAVRIAADSPSTP